MHTLGRTLRVPRRAVGHRSEVLDKEEVKTLWSKHQLAETFYQQRKYAEAEELFVQVVQGQEEVLGKEHVDTLKSLYWLAETLYRQGKYIKAEELFQ